MPSATVTLTFDPGGPGESILTLFAPLPGYQPSHDKKQAVGRTEAGKLYVYDKAADTYELLVTFRMTAAQKAAWTTWYTDKVVGGLNTFRYVDHLGVTHPNCRILPNRISFSKTAGAGYEVSLVIETPSAVD
jgi:hypothetical protein